MKKIILPLLVLLFAIASYSQTLTTPEKFFGFKPGADRMLFTYEQLIDYLKMADQQSDRLSMFEIGKSPMGKSMYVACISSPENLKNLDTLKAINRKLALDPDMDENTVARLVSSGKVFVLATLSMHSVEVAPNQSFPLTAYSWLTSSDPAIVNALSNVVMMVVPCHNPDGMDSVVNYYNRNKGTKYEGTSLPGLYHKYVGHDNNRDFIFLSQSDTKAISSLTSTDWFPQVMIEKHQMGGTDPRYYVPPTADPIAENVDASLFIWTGIFGQQMISDLTEAGLKGVVQHALFDNYWPGSTETCIWKNVIAMLTEAASCHVASPVYVEPTELTGGEKGLAEYKKGTNMPEPWPGGWWRLGDIVQYELVSMDALLETASQNKDKILALRNELCKKEVNLGKTEAPYYFIFPAGQPDPSELVHLVNILQEQGVDVYALKKNMVLGQSSVDSGSLVVPLAQPFRAFIKEVLEAQKYPERHYVAGGALMEPYDITTWSMPLHMGLNCIQADTRSEELEKSLEKVLPGFTLGGKIAESPYYILESVNNGSYRLAFEALQKSIPVKRCLKDFILNGKTVPAGSFLIEKGKGTEELLKKADFPVIPVKEIPAGEWKNVSLPRIALVESYIQDMDAGWTRFVLDDYRVGYTILRPADFAKAGLAKKFDLVLFPDEEASILKDGKFKVQDQYRINNYRPEYAKGMGAKGLDSLVAFFYKGGKIISWGGSTLLFDQNLAYKSRADSDEFHLPFRNIGNDAALKDVKCPGSFLRMDLVKGTSLTYGMGEKTGIFYRGKPLYATSIPNFDMDRRVVGYFGEDELLLSGFLEGKKALQNKAVMLWMKKGKGQITLMGFSPIFRASVPADYKLLFNAILSTGE